jgi:Tfp pilus assembly pilus retraction ATPase PilT
MTSKQKEKFEENLELDFSVDLQNYSRFRVNVFIQRK